MWDCMVGKRPDLTPFPFPNSPPRCSLALNLLPPRRCSRSPFPPISSDISDLSVMLDLKRGFESDSISHKI